MNQSSCPGLQVVKCPSVMRYRSSPSKRIAAAVPRPSTSTTSCEASVAVSCAPARQPALQARSHGTLGELERRLLEDAARVADPHPQARAGHLVGTDPQPHIAGRLDLVVLGEVPDAVGGQRRVAAADLGVAGGLHLEAAEPFDAVRGEERRQVGAASAGRGARASGRAASPVPAPSRHPARAQTRASPPARRVWDRVTSRRDGDARFLTATIAQSLSEGNAGSDRRDGPAAPEP